MNFADDWVRTADLWCWKRPRYQLRHNHCPLIKSILLQSNQIPLLKLDTNLSYLTACNYLAIIIFAVSPAVNNSCLCYYFLLKPTDLNLQFLHLDTYHFVLSCTFIKLFLHCLLWRTNRSRTLRQGAPTRNGVSSKPLFPLEQIILIQYIGAPQSYLTVGQILLNLKGPTCEQAIRTFTKAWYFLCTIAWVLSHN